LAFSAKAAAVKGVNSPVAGDTDVMLVPDIEAGNLLGKSFSFLCGGRMAGLVLGANCPVILPSRSDSDENKFIQSWQLLLSQEVLSNGISNINHKSRFDKY